MMDISTYIQWIVTCGGPSYSPLPSGNYYKEMGFEYENGLAALIRNNLSKIKNFDWAKVITTASGKCNYDPNEVQRDYDRYISSYGQEVGTILFGIKYSVTYCISRLTLRTCYNDCHPMRNLVIVALKDGRVYTVQPQKPEDVRKAIQLLKYDAVAYIQASDSTAGPPGSIVAPSFDSLLQTLEVEYWKQKTAEWYAQWNAPQQGTSAPSQQATGTAQGSRTWIWVALGLGALALFLAFQKD
jgi:hypothetical protein